MRLDKFLKVSRLVKRRTVAKELAAAGRVTVNGRPAKPGTEVAVGDKLEITFGANKTNVTILRVAEHVRKDEAEEMYRIETS